MQEPAGLRALQAFEESAYSAALGLNETGKYNPSIKYSGHSYQYVGSKLPADVYVMIGTDDKAAGRIQQAWLAYGKINLTSRTALADQFTQFVSAFEGIDSTGPDYDKLNDKVKTLVADERLWPIQGSVILQPVQVGRASLVLDTHSFT